MCCRPLHGMTGSPGTRTTWVTGRSMAAPSTSMPPEPGTCTRRTWTGTATPTCCRLRGATIKSPGTRTPWQTRTRRISRDSRISRRTPKEPNPCMRPIWTAMATSMCFPPPSTATRSPGTKTRVRPRRPRRRRTESTPWPGQGGSRLNGNRCRAQANAAGTRRSAMSPRRRRSAVARG